MILSEPSITYLKRFLLWNYPTINDYKKFSYQKIVCNETPFLFKKDMTEELQLLGLLKTIEYQYKKESLRCSFDELLTSTGTTAFIIIKENRVLYEKYFNNYQRESINTSFSIAKSFTSVLIGIAIDEGYIKSVEDYVIDYLPELKSRVSDSLTIKHLLNMSSGIKYNPKYFPWADEPKSYFYPDLKKLVLESTKQEYPPGLYFKYSNYNTILLGLILLRATKFLPQEYLQNKIWIPIGMEFSATWSTDNIKNNFAKMESGINARSIDFAKFGQLLLNSGRWENIQIVSQDWVKESTCPFDLDNNQYYLSKNYFPYSMFFKDKQIYYKYGWWGLKRNANYYDFMAIGNLGQFLFISAKMKLIIVRNGIKWGKIDWWPRIFDEIIEKLKNVA